MKVKKHIFKIDKLCKLCNKVFSLHNWVQHTQKKIKCNQIPITTWYKCNICHKYNKTTAFNKHMQRHNKLEMKLDKIEYQLKLLKWEKKYFRVKDHLKECKICYKPFTLFGMRKHLIKKHKININEILL